MATSPCSHLSSIKILEAPDEVDGCEQCLMTGDGWVHLRMCMTCGEVGCCDDSPNQHASKHAAQQQHPVIRSVELGEAWCYCYVDDAFFQLAGVEARREPAEHRVVHHDEVSRLDLWVGNDVVSWLRYERVGDAYNVTEVGVADGQSGMGFDGEILRESIDILTNQGHSIIPSDEFARAYITYRPELHGVVPASMRARMLGED